MDSKSNNDDWSATWRVRANSELGRKEHQRLFWATLSEPSYDCFEKSQCRSWYCKASGMAGSFDATVPRSRITLVSSSNLLRHFRSNRKSLIFGEWACFHRKFCPFGRDKAKAHSGARWAGIPNETYHICLSLWILVMYQGMRRSRMVNKLD